MTISERYFNLICSQRMKSRRTVTVLTPRELCHYLDISIGTLKRWHTPNSPFYRPFFPVVKIGSIRRFVKEKVDAYLQIS